MISAKSDMSFPNHHSLKWIPMSLRKCAEMLVLKTHKMSAEWKQLSSLHTMVIIYIMIYSQSQKANSFQVALSRTLQQFGISKQGLESLRNFGITANL